MKIGVTRSIFKTSVSARWRAPYAVILRHNATTKRGGGTCYGLTQGLKHMLFFTFGYEYFVKYALGIGSYGENDLVQKYTSGTVIVHH